jgi:hypothetical protein
VKLIDLASVIVGGLLGRERHDAGPPAAAPKQLTPGIPFIDPPTKNAADTGYEYALPFAAYTGPADPVGLLLEDRQLTRLGTVHVAHTDEEHEPLPD